MRPSFTINNAPQCGSGNSYFFGQGINSDPLGMQFSCFQNLSVCQLGAWIRFAANISIAILSRAISRIVLVSSKPQMIWIDARTHIALMQDTKTSGDRTFENSPTNSMRSVAFGFFRSGKSAIAALLGSLPQPASLCFFHEAKKSIFQGWCNHG